jgi:hypothetical protein
MGAPGIEACTPGFTVTYYGPLGATETVRFQVLPITTGYSAQPQPPTYEPRLSHIYKCLGGQL